MRGRMGKGRGMMTNVGVIDRALRLIVGFGLLGWSWGWFGPRLADGAETTLALLGAYPALTGLLRWDPVFAAAGISTCADDG